MTNLNKKIKKKIKNIKIINKCIIYFIIYIYFNIIFINKYFLLLSEIIIIY